MWNGQIGKKFSQAERAPQTLGLRPGKSTGCILSCAYKWIIVEKKCPSQETLQLYLLICYLEF